MFVLQLSTSMSEKFASRSDLVQNIKRNVDANFNSYTRNQDNAYKECCKTDINNEYNYQFKGLVDLHKFCIRQSEFAGDNKRYATSSLLQAFKQNHNSADELKWQYFGTEEGLSFVYPSSKASDCDSYDPRFRWVFLFINLQAFI